MTSMEGQGGVGGSIAYYLYVNGYFKGEISVEDVGMFATGPAFSGMPSVASLSGSVVASPGLGSDGSGGGSPSATGTSPNPGIAPTASAVANSGSPVQTQQVSPSAGSDLQAGPPRRGGSDGSGASSGTSSASAPPAGDSGRAVAASAPPADTGAGGAARGSGGAVDTKL